MIIEAVTLAQIINPKEPLPQPPPPTTVKVEPKPEPKKKKIYYTIKKGDSLSKISKHFRVPLRRLICANTKLINPDMIYSSEKLRIPQKNEKLKCSIKKHLNIQKTNKSTAPSGWYPYGQCTWWVSTKRPVGKWHDATNWLSSAQAEGYATGSVPRAGAIGWTSGHVVYVESVNSDGSVVISEANYDYNGSIRTITVPASKYIYIY